MLKKDSKAFNLGLKGKSVDDLRTLAIKYVGINPLEASSIDKNELLNLLTVEVNNNTRLEREVKKASVSIKPSFYIMVLTPKARNILSLSRAKSKLQEELGRIGEKEKDEASIYRGFTVEDAIEHSKDVLEFQFTWQHIHWYWEPIEVSLKHIYEFRFGFAILDFKSRKAIIACQTEQERRFISKALAKIYPITLTSIVLTKPLLDQIGTFEHVKRAGYFIAKPDLHAPSNITYADENLGSKSIALDEENNSRSQRKHSFYLIPLGSIVEQGVGVTSDSGKLWIPRETPLDSVRQYGIELLKKVGTTLDLMTKNKEYANVLESLGIPRLPGINTIKNIIIRNYISGLIEELVHMLLRGEIERNYKLDSALAVNAVPSLFEYPRLLLTDSDTNEMSYWKNPDGSSQMIRVSRQNGNLKLNGFPFGEAIDLQSLRHPITDNAVEIEDPISSLYFIPTHNLHEIILESITHVSQQIPSLRDVKCVPFYLLRNQIHLDVERAFGRSGLDQIGELIEPRNINEMRDALKHSLTVKQRERVIKQLVTLGEKCGYMNDGMCQACLSELDNKRLCLRSLVAKYLKTPLILAHKGIELSDLQAKATISKKEVSIFGFAKLATGKDGLTARNKNGAILLAQVLGQVDKPVFDVVMVVSPSTINEDLRNRLLVLCGVFNKKLLLVDELVLASLLLDFEFDNSDYLSVYQNSRKKTSGK